MKNLLIRTELAPAQDSSPAAKRLPAKRKLPPWLGLSLVMLLTGAVVFTGHCGTLTCDDCCRPDGSGGKGWGIYKVGIDANGFLWCGCVPADYPPCFFGGPARPVRRTSVRPGRTATAARATGNRFAPGS